MALTGSWARSVKEILKSQQIRVSSIDAHLEDTGLDKLPQANIIRGVTGALLGEDVLQEVYLRGSFSHGQADKLSDVDIMAVVDPEDLSATYDTAVEYLEENYPIVISCHDRLVKDFGGIGFMFICENDEGSLTQIDLYFALKGVAPTDQLKGATRVYAKDPDYYWVAEGKKDPLPEDATEFIRHHTAGQGDKAKQLDVLAREMIVTMAVMDKHLKRGQQVRAFCDNQAATYLNVEMLGIISGQPESVHSPEYRADQLIADLKEGGSDELKGIAAELERSIMFPVSASKVGMHLDIMECIVATRAEQDPELLATVRRSKEIIFNSPDTDGDPEAVVSIAPYLAER